MKILTKIGVVEAKISHFFLRSCELTLKWDPCELGVAQMGPLRTIGEAQKRGSSGLHIPIRPFYVSAPSGKLPFIQKKYKLFTN